MKKYVLLAITLLTTQLFAQDRPLRIGVEGAYPPFSEVNSKGELVGFDIDIAKALCAEMKRECDLIQIDWDGLIPAIKSRKIDAIIASMIATAEREKIIDFTDRYYKSPAKVIRKKGMDISFSKESMKGKTIGVQRSTTVDSHMTDLFGDVTTIKRYGSSNEVFIDLKAGRLDVVAAELIALKSGFLDTEAGEGYEFFGPDLVDAKYYKGIAVGVDKGKDELKEAFNIAIKAIRENGTYKEINDKYFDFDIYGAD